MAKGAKQRWGRDLTRLAISGFLLLLFGLHVQGTLRLELIDRVESYLYDARVRLTMPATIDERIVIVDIDEASLASLGQWPWPRDTLARIVDSLFDNYNIRILGFDVVFAEKEESSGERVLNDLASGEIGGLAELQQEIRRIRETLGGDLRFAESLIARDVVTGFVFKDRLGEGEFPAKGALPPVLLRQAEIDALEIVLEPTHVLRVL
jgi:adenylate cyclase